jgi:hypothetical protein
MIRELHADIALLLLSYNIQVHGWHGMFFFQMYANYTCRKAESYKKWI